MTLQLQQIACRLLESVLPKISWKSIVPRCAKLGSSVWGSRSVRRPRRAERLRAAEQERPFPFVLRQLSRPFELSACFAMSTELGQEVAARAGQQMVLAERGLA